MMSDMMTPEDIDFMNVLHNPIWLAECLFIDNMEILENFKYYDDNKYFTVRMYQIPMVDFGYMLFQDDETSDEEYFKMLMAAGNCYNYSGRGIGKSVFILLDLFLETIHRYRNWQTLLSSFDEDHVNALLEPYEETIKEHPLLKMFLCSKTDIDAKKMEVKTGYGHIVTGVNMALTSKNPGSSFEHFHAHKHVIDEHQYEPDEVLKKRSQAKAQYGKIERCAGITAFGEEDPAGRIFKDPDKQHCIVNLPKTVGPTWDRDQKKQAIDDYNGEEEPAYKIHILAEVVRNLRGLWNMEKIKAAMQRPNGTDRPDIKHFEISEKEFEIFDSLLVIERPASSLGAFIAGDFGTTVTEICVLFVFENAGEKLYKYEYNITLHRLMPDQQKLIFQHLYRLLDPMFIAMDTTEIGGRDVIYDLRKNFEPDGTQDKQSKFIECDKNLSISVDMDGKDNSGPERKRVNLKDWAVYYLQKIIYNGRFKALYDRKLYKQFNAIKSTKKPGSHKSSYISSIGVDHLHAALLVFGYLAYLYENDKMDIDDDSTNGNVDSISMTVR